MKKITGFALILSLVLSSAIPAMGAATDSKGLEQAILKVKSIVAIPEDYKDFQYSTRQYVEDGKTVSVWDLNWNNDDYSGGISATVQDGGYLINYNKYYYSGRNEGLGTVTREAGQRTASDFLAKARPDIAADLRLEKNTDSSASDRHYYRYKLYKNDILVSYVEARVEVDKHTGEVVGYYLQGVGEDLMKLPSADGVIGLEAAKAAWLEKISVPLSYYSYYDYTKKILTVFPAYSGSNTERKVIDAKTGKAVPLYSGGIYYRDMGGGAMEKAVADDTAAGNLSKEEIAAVENISNLITKEKAESIIRNTVPGITASMKAESAYLQKSYAEKDKYLWEIGFDGAYGSVNAKTGELVSFYLYTEKSGKGLASLSEARAKEKAESFLKKISPEKFSQSRFYESPGYIAYRTAPSDITEYRFNYYRQVNGIDLVSNGFSITVNKASGMIVQYNCNWFDSAEFPAIDGVITEEAAFDRIDDAAEFSLMYKKVNDGDTALVYDFTDNTESFLIDPFTGARLGHDGKPFKDRSVPEYSDIKGHWAEAAIKKLMENGYYLEGEKFNPAQKITQIGFLRYLYSPDQSYYDDEEFYKMLINEKIIKEEEKDPKAEITRQDAAKFAVRFLGQGKVAEHPEIFVNPFKDRIADEYKGYAAICYGLKIMRGDKNGRFNGTNQVTNAEAAVIVYNALQVK